MAGKQKNYGRIIHYVPKPSLGPTPLFLKGREAWLLSVSCFSSQKNRNKIDKSYLQIKLAERQLFIIFVLWLSPGNKVFRKKLMENINHQHFTT